MARPRCGQRCNDTMCVLCFVRRPRRDKYNLFLIKSNFHFLMCKQTSFCMAYFGSTSKRSSWYWWYQTSGDFAMNVRSKRVMNEIKASREPCLSSLFTTWYAASHVGRTDCASLHRHQYIRKINQNYTHCRILHTFSIIVSLLRIIRRALTLCIGMTNRNVCTVVV